MWFNPQPLYFPNPGIATVPTTAVEETKYWGVQHQIAMAVYLLSIEGSLLLETMETPLQANTNVKWGGHK